MENQEINQEQSLEQVQATDTIATQTNDTRILCADCGKDITDDVKNNKTSEYIIVNVRRYTNERGVYNETVYYCSGCTTQCYDCSLVIPIATSNTVYQGRETNNEVSVCESCYNNYGSCSHCGGNFYEDFYRIDRNGDSYCDNCIGRGCGEFDSDDEDSDENSFFSSRSWTPIDDNNYIKGEYSIKRLVGCEIETESNDDTDSYINDNIPSYTGLVGDGSLNNGVEIITPPLRGLQLETCLKDVCKGINISNLVVENTCGLHIHLDARDFRNRPLKIAQLVQTYEVIEPVIYAMLPTSRKSNSYCISLDKLAEQHKEKIKDIKRNSDTDALKLKTAIYQTESKADIENRQNYKYDHVRYYGCNIHSIYFRGTFEVRYHSGTTNYNKIINWIRLHYAVVEWVNKHYDKNQLSRIEQQIQPENKLQVMADVFNLKSDLVEYINNRIDKFQDREQELEDN